MKLRPFSDHQRGLFVSVDGPSGAGKSTIVQHLAQLLVAAGEDVHVTAEPCAMCGCAFPSERAPDELMDDTEQQMRHFAEV